MCDKQGTYRHPKTGQKAKKCPKKHGVNLRRDAKGKLYCPIGGFTCVERLKPIRNP